jgi:hypothetical protein
MIRPEFWTSESVVELPVEARLLFIGIWNFADDGGVHPWKAKQLKMKVFPSDDFGGDSVEKWLNRLAAEGLIFDFESAGDRFLKVTNWEAYQVIRHPSYRYPQATVDNGRITVTLPQDISKNTGVVRPKRRGVKRSGVKRSKEETTKPPLGPSPTDSDLEDTASPVLCGVKIPLTPKDGELEPTEADCEDWSKAYPIFGDVEGIKSELLRIAEWCKANPANRKTKRGARKFITGWLARAQNRGKANGGGGRKYRSEYHREHYEGDEGNINYIEVPDEEITVGGESERADGKN